MRTMIPLLVFTLLIFSASPSSDAAGQVVALAEGESLEAALADARRELEIAKIERRLYQQIEFPRKRRQLNGQVTMLRAEMDALKVQVREYTSFNRSRFSRPFLTTTQCAELALVDTELQWEDAVAERNALRRFHSDQCRLYDLRVEAARARVVALDRLAHGP